MKGVDFQVHVKVEQINAYLFSDTNEIKENKNWRKLHETRIKTT